MWSSYDDYVSLTYDQSNLLLTNITDPVGLSSQVVYTNPSGFGFTPPLALLTPYGTTWFDATNTHKFDRVVWVTNTIGRLELYGQSASYWNSDWSNYLPSQIPTNTCYRLISQRTSGEIGIVLILAS